MKAKAKKKKEYIEVPRFNWLLLIKTIIFYPFYIIATIWMCIILIVMSFIPVLGGYVSWSLYTGGDSRYWDTEVNFIEKVKYEVRSR